MRNRSEAEAKTILSARTSCKQSSAAAGVAPNATGSILYTNFPEIRELQPQICKHIPATGRARAVQFVYINCLTNVYVNVNIDVNIITNVKEVNAWER